MPKIRHLTGPHRQSIANAVRYLNDAVAATREHLEESGIWEDAYPLDPDDMPDELGFEIDNLPLDVQLDSGLIWEQLSEVASYLYAHLVMNCQDCNCSVLPNDEYAILTDELWAQIGAGDDYLCWDCMTARAGRPLAASDFKIISINARNPNVKTLFDIAGIVIPAKAESEHEEHEDGHTCDDCQNVSLAGPIGEC